MTTKEDAKYYLIAATATICLLTYLLSQQCFTIVGQNIFHDISCQIAAHKPEQPEFNLNPSASSTSPTAVNSLVSLSNSATFGTPVSSPSLAA